MVIEYAADFTAALINYLCLVYVKSKLPNRLSITHGLFPLFNPVFFPVCYRMFSLAYCLATYRQIFCPVGPVFRCSKAAL